MERPLSHFTDAVTWAQQIAADTIDTTALLVADVDDTMLDGHAGWYELYCAYATRNALPPVDRATFKADGPRVHLGPLVSGYPSLKDQLMADVGFNSDLPVLGQAEDVAHLLAAGLPHGYLSTRPAHLGEATAANLTNLGFPSVPLLVRPAHIAYAATVPYKVDALRQLRDMLDDAGRQIPVYYVDDYDQVVDAVNERLPGVVGVLYTAQTTWRQLLRDIGLPPPDSYPYT